MVCDGDSDGILIKTDNDGNTIDICQQGSLNTPPDKPDAPDGPPSGNTGETYIYTSSATDPDGDGLIYLCPSSKDGVEFIFFGPYGPVASGDLIPMDMSWEEQGTYELYVLAQDDYGLISPFSDPLTVSMPRNKAYINTPFLNFLEQHPILYQLLQRFLRF